MEERFLASLEGLDGCIEFESMHEGSLVVVLSDWGRKYFRSKTLMISMKALSILSAASKNLQSSILSSVW